MFLLRHRGPPVFLVDNTRPPLMPIRQGEGGVFLTWWAEKRKGGVWKKRHLHMIESKGSLPTTPVFGSKPERRYRNRL